MGFFVDFRPQKNIFKTLLTSVFVL